MLVRIEAQDVDAGSSAAPVTLFVRCRQKPIDTSSNRRISSSSPVLQLDVIDGDALYRGDVDAQHKPAALDCSGREYVLALETALSASPAATRAFTHKWSRTRSELTLMEQTAAAAFAMKYTSLALTRVERTSDRRTHWRALLQDVVDSGAHSARETAQQRARIAELEARLVAKDSVLDAALRAKQQLEDELFDGFCAVLNGKKDEIQRLQHEVAVAQMQTKAVERSLAVNNAAQIPAKVRKRKHRTQQQLKRPAKGAKLQRCPSDESDDQDESDGQDEHDDGTSSSNSDVNEGDNDDIADLDANVADGDNDALSDVEIETYSTQRERGRRAVSAYSQLPTPTVSQVCTADDVLADLGAIMQQEVAAADHAIQDDEGGHDKKNRSKRPRAVTRRGTGSTTKKPKRNDAPPRAAARANAVAPAPKAQPAPQAVKAIDSEEEDILDMLA